MMTFQPQPLFSKAASFRPEPFFRRREESPATTNPRVSPSLANRRIRLIRMNPQILHRLLHHIGPDLLLARQRSKRSQHNMLRIDFKEVAQRRPVLAASESI